MSLSSKCERERKESNFEKGMEENSLYYSLCSIEQPLWYSLKGPPNPLGSVSASDGLSPPISTAKAFQTTVLYKLLKNAIQNIIFMNY